MNNFSSNISRDEYYTAWVSYFKNGEEKYEKHFFQIILGSGIKMGGKERMVPAIAGRNFGPSCKVDIDSISYFNPTIYT